MNGKGSRPRSNFSAKYREGYDLIFRKKKIKPVVNVVSEMESYKLVGSERVLLVHSKNKCKGNHCPIHNHSNHHMKEWPQHWRGDRGIMERICPHGIGHPDPDDPTTDRIHGCDGCCSRFWADSQRRKL